PVLILFKNESGDHLEDSQKTFLSNILKAVNLQLDVVALLNFKVVDLGLEKILKASQAKIILSFGLSDHNDFKQLPEYAIHKHGKYDILKADDLSAIAADQGLKKSLWTNLQQLFLK
ncbi:hypothetical protein E1176_02950, partial [Fulvivirga sp. RKSG066]